jgi:serine/threonine-protein kinase
MAEASPSRGQWRRVNEIFHVAAELPAGEREAYVEREAGGDEALCREVKSLLAAEDSPLSLLDGSALDALTEIPRPPYRVGSYRLLHPIARGGMGSVYLAQRDDDQYRQQVAVKILRHSLADPHSLDRFLRERQILADLDHPHIAKLLDGGVTEGGLPYLVLEHIDGEPIDGFCDRHGLSVEERIRLFSSVCSAVSHAHRHLIVHRDLKPANILVTAAGVPKLLDFGIAKLLDPVAAETATTLGELRPMTPEYASPEQVQGRRITTASDVYSLGVLLYKLLTGRLPYRVTACSPLETARIVCEQEPKPPSTALDSRRYERRRHWPRGDLDAIVLKALCKEPERRYPGVDQMAEDLRRHLEGLPVSACRDTWGYRAGKFLLRHRLGVAAAVLVAASVAAGSAATLWQAHEAEARQSEAQAALDFVVRMFEASDPAQARGVDVTARELLDRAEAEIRRQPAAEPRVQVKLMAALGEIDLNLGLLDRAEALLEDALEIGAAAGAPAEETLKIRNRLGFVYVEQDRYDRAEKTLRASLDTVRHTFGPGHPLALEAMSELGSLLARQGRSVEAETLLARALEVWRHSPGSDSSEAVDVRLYLAQTVAWQGRYREAEPLVAEALSITRRELGEDHPDTLLTLNNLGALDIELGRYEEAERILGPLLETRRRVLGNEHPHTSSTMNNLAKVYQHLGRRAEARALYEKSLAIKAATLGPDHRDTLVIRSNLAALDLDEGRLIEAEEALGTVLAEQRRLHGEGHHRTLTTSDRLARVYLAGGRPGEAERLFARALEAARRSSLPARHQLVGRLLAGQGRALAALGRYEEAEAALAEGHGILLRALGPEHDSTREAAAALAELDEARSARAGPRAHGGQGPQLASTISKSRLSTTSSALRSSGQAAGQAGQGPQADRIANHSLIPTVPSKSKSPKQVEAQPQRAAPKATNGGAGGLEALSKEPPA